MFRVLPPRRSLSHTHTPSNSPQKKRVFSLLLIVQSLYKRHRTQQCLLAVCLLSVITFPPITHTPSAVAGSTINPRTPSTRPAYLSLSAAPDAPTRTPAGQQLVWAVAFSIDAFLPFTKPTTPLSGRACSDHGARRLPCKGWAGARRRRGGVSRRACRLRAPSNPWAAVSCSNCDLK